MIRIVTACAALLLLFTVDSRAQTHEADNPEKKLAVVPEVPDRVVVTPSMTGDEYLALNAQREGVTVTRSGLQYEVLTSGDGATPRRRDRVVTHYRGSFIDGREFDSSFKRNKPLEFRADGVIPGWSEALLLMQEGDRWRLHIPYKLGYGKKGYGPIPPKSVLIFEVELLEVKKP